MLVLLVYHAPSSAIALPNAVELPIRIPFAMLYTTRYRSLSQGEAGSWFLHKNFAFVLLVTTSTRIVVYNKPSLKLEFEHGTAGRPLHG